MSHGKSGMGMSKHRKSGSTGKSPKLRHALSREALRCSKTNRHKSLPYSTVAEALRG